MGNREYTLLMNHEYWANQRVAEAVLALEEIPAKARKLMNHIIGAQDTWIKRIRGEEGGIGVFPELDQNEWLSILKANHDALLAIASDENETRRIIHYQNTRGDQFSNPVSELLLHLALHAQYHRGQIIAYSRDLIQQPPVSDMIAFLRIEK